MTRKQKRVKSKVKSSSSARWLRFLILILILISLCLYLTKPKYWNKKASLATVYPTDGGVSLSIFDPVLRQQVNIDFPDSTQVSVSRQLGTWRLGSVWKLGESDNLEGKLLTETISKNFHFPVFTYLSADLGNWIDRPTLGNYLNVVLDKETNLSLGDRMRMLFFAKKVKNTDRIEIDLTSTPLLKKTRLVDGTDGYIITGSVPGRILSFFAYHGLSDKSYKAVIVDQTGHFGIANSIGATLETVGVKVALTQKKEINDSDCRIWGNDQDLTAYLANIFGCEVTQGDNASFDITIEIGEAFAKRY